MLWLQWEGGQLPIGWDRGPVATIGSLFGTSWKLYEDVNHSNGMTVVCLAEHFPFRSSGSKWPGRLAKDLPLASYPPPSA